MRTAREPRKHRDSVRRVGGLAENPPVENDRRIGAENRRLAARPRPTCLRLGRGDAKHVTIRRFVRQNGFVDVNADHPVRHADLREEFPAARRAGGKINEFRGHGVRIAHRAPYAR